jgi:hypothetical protein
MRTCAAGAAGAALDAAVLACPFLSACAASEGGAFARRFALDPLGASAGAGPVFCESEAAAFLPILNLFHGPEGLVPLPSAAPAELPAAAEAKVSRGAAAAAAAAPTRWAPAAHPLAGAPAAAISLGAFNLPSPGDWFGLRPRRQQRRPRGKGAKGKGAGGKPPAPDAAAAVGAPPAAPGAAAGGGRCPLRRVFGPLGGLLPAIAASGRLECPRAIVAARAAVAALPPVRALRPRALPVRSAALAAAVSSAASLAGQLKQKTPQKTNRPTNHSLITDHYPK